MTATELERSDREMRPTMVMGTGFRGDPCEDDMVEREAIDEETADVLCAHADGELTSEDYAELIALAVAHGFRPRSMRPTTRMTDAQRAAPTLPPPGGDL